MYTLPPLRAIALYGWPSSHIQSDQLTKWVFLSLFLTELLINRFLPGVSQSLVGFQGQLQHCASLIRVLQQAMNQAITSALDSNSILVSRRKAPSCWDSCMSLCTSSFLSTSWQASSTRSWLTQNQLLSQALLNHWPQLVQKPPSWVKTSSIPSTGSLFLDICLLPH